MRHARHDAVSLALATRIAERLSAHPEWVDRARSNLHRWSDQNHDAPHLLACYREWQGLLQLPIEQISAILVDPATEGQRLRQNSPFAGVLATEEVWRIKREIYAKTAT